MGDYISREMALHAIMAAYGDAAEAEDNVRAIPATDVKRVRHGHWIENVGQFVAVSESDYVTIPAHRCSLCKKIAPAPWIKKYCPNCGAKMDGGDSDG